MGSGGWGLAAPGAAPLLLGLTLLLLGAALGYLAAARRERDALERLRAQERERSGALLREAAQRCKVEEQAMREQLGRLAQQLSLARAELSGQSQRYDRELSLWRQAALAAHAAASAVPDYPDRPSLRELGALCEGLRGFHGIGVVTVADSSGLLCAPGAGSKEEDLASLAAVLCGCEPFLGAGRLGGVLLQGDDGRFVAARALPAWTRGTWLLCESSGQAPSELALDAAVGRALLQGADAPAALAGAEGPSLRGTVGVCGAEGPGSVLPDLRELQERSGARMVALGQGGALTAAAFLDGPSVRDCAQLLRACERLRTRGAFRLRCRDLLRLDLQLASGLTLSLVPLSLGSKNVLLVLRDGPPLEPRQFTATLGRVRRAVSVTTSLPPARNRRPTAPPPPPRPSRLSRPPEAPWAFA